MMIKLKEHYKGKEKLYIKAKSIVKSSQNCSTSYLQRKLEVGYNRAGAIIELLEKNNIISPPDEKGIRTII